MKILILSVSLGLLLGLAERPAWGQPQGQEAVKAPGHEPSVSAASGGAGHPGRRPGPRHTAPSGRGVPPGGPRA